MKKPRKPRQKLAEESKQFLISQGLPVVAATYYKSCERFVLLLLTVKER